MQPRRFKYKSKHKIRKLNTKYNNKGNILFGQIGLKLLQPLRLTSKNVFRIKLFLNKSAKRSEETRRKIWLNVFPHWPLTKKTIGSRMGKGTGKLKTWVSKLNTGHILVEFKNLRRGRAIFFLKQIQYRIKCSSKIITRLNFSVNLPNNFSKNNVSYQSFW